jgi:quinol-cytochrome oxidoreductase complex cytochrome b subunit
LIVNGPFLASLPSLLSAVSKLSSVLWKTSKIRKKLVLDNDEHRANTKMKYQEPRTLFFGIVAIFVVCYIEVAICAVDDFEHQEKTRPKHR